MADKRMRFLRWYRRYRRACGLAGLVLLVLIGIATVFLHAKEEKPQAVSAPVRAEYENYMDPENNPLIISENKEINLAVLKYYKRLTENTDYIENYEDFMIYIKSGQYENTWIVFARYKMKIKEIYTPVPGLGTLYVEKERDGAISINSRVTDNRTQKMIAQITQHEDVKDLFREVETAYKEAVQSDAMLAEALEDLKRAAADTKQKE